MRPFLRIPPRDDCYDFNPESPIPIRPEEGSRSCATSPQLGVEVLSVTSPMLGER
jgi:hypothetical protein